MIAEEGAYLGRHHLTPTNLGHLLVTNPTDREATLRWSTGGITLDAGSSLNLSLPSTSTGADRLSSTGPVLESASNMSQQPQPVSENQHPGWIWDAASNQWVADPNYQPSE